MDCPSRLNPVALCGFARTTDCLCAAAISQVYEGLPARRSSRRRSHLRAAIIRRLMTAYHQWCPDAEADNLRMAWRVKQQPLAL